MWIVAPLAVLGAVGAGWLIYRFIVDPIVADAADAIKLTLAILTLTGAVLAGVYAYRKQRIAESDAHRADANQFADRYTTAAGQLGHDKAAVRLAGVYALARLADDWEEQRQVCIDVLCAYLRMPYQTNPNANGYKEGEREVRHTIIRLIRDHLRLAPTHPHSWQGCDFDFTAVSFDGGDLSGAVFSGGTVSFTRAEFTGGTVSFNRATVSGGTVDFRRAAFSGGLVSFDRAMFSGGTVNFNRATFSGGRISFDGAKFSGSTVGFAAATFSGGTVGFDDAVFSGGTVNFGGATLSSTFILVRFNRAAFSGGAVSFQDAMFSGGLVSFDGAAFSGGLVRFNEATFSDGLIRFNDATFSNGLVSFDGVTLSGGSVDLRSVASWATPPRFDDGVSGNPPTGLLLPSPVVGS
ncbi:pentapeptide repeat-containing protein [Streptomyces sp. NBC_00882]|uniref:pentapeptide repeat-containing protein n=1 Tax=Streptomyces sp. NBC_00882 TaxID=2975856 RepID=UPI00386371EE|nr:pentapeptide repeat-containing protein [Streptomyces sp. NBC_00882]WSZ36875.1 pentapeptide repeat-containing protein [Streptomyces sp. NBC_00882]